ncbi:hypothetical protein NDU88_006155 [Pleurodeles waltl]|uniref:Integrase zinc-binding domain-containing protein n=1 Tax=Pleurodeles waltl TaxID=8319 RepID=A0AAV7LN85_PLEWA|nr:hypothetical protein NDU88_006155 [Pleurodeles waltl]
MSKRTRGEGGQTHRTPADTDPVRDDRRREHPSPPDDATRHAVKKQIASLTPASKRTMESLCHVRNELSVDPDGCLLRGYRMVIPSSLTDRIVQLAHYGHLGMVKMKSRLRIKVRFPLLDKQVETGAIV